MRLVTIMHTGTVFTRELMQSWGVEVDFRHLHRAVWRERDTVMTARDPMLTAISAVNRDTWVDHKLWRKMAKWVKRGGVHVFRVDGPEEGKGAEAAALAAFCGVEAVGVDWTPKNSRPGDGELLAAYRAGEVPQAVKKVWDWLRVAPDVSEMFTELGYCLPWMR